MRRILPLIVSFLTFTMISAAQTPGNSLSFDGADDYVLCPLTPVFTNIGTNDFTIELWASPTNGSFQRLFFAQNDVDNFTSISLGTNGEVIFYLEANGINHSVQSLTQLNSLEWAHISVTWNAANSDARIYINGEETNYDSGLFVSSVGNDATMTIGSKTDGSQSFLGQIDEVAIWSIAKFDCLNSFEMRDKKTGSEPGLVTYFNFDAGTDGGSNPGVDLLQDITGNSLDGTLTNFALSGSTSNWVFSGASIIRFWGGESSVFLGQLGLVSTISADNYQWIYCPSGSIVSGATNVTFDPPSEDPNYTGVTDAYAVISTTGNCVDTSACFWFNGSSSINENNLESLVSVYPNPSNGLVSIQSSLQIEQIEIRSITGELVKTIQPNSSEIINVELTNQNGFYLIVLHTSMGLLTKKILVQDK